MTDIEKRHFPELPDRPIPKWLDRMTDKDRAIYEEAREVQVEELQLTISGIIEQYIPGIDEADPQLLHALSLRWASGLRNHWEVGIQDGIEITEESRRPIDDWNSMVARNHVGNWAG